MARILVVDDDPAICDLVQTYLEGEGHQVAVAGDGDGMRRAVAQSPADLVILDLVLPGEDGFSLTPELRGAPMSALSS